jgi:hypothetical protein
LVVFDIMGQNTSRLFNNRMHCKRFHFELTTPTLSFNEATITEIVKTIVLQKVNPQNHKIVPKTHTLHQVRAMSVVRATCGPPSSLIWPANML